MCKNTLTIPARLHILMKMPKTGLLLKPIFSIKKCNDKPKDYIPFNLPSCVDYFFFLSLSLLTGVIGFKLTPVLSLFIRVCNRKGTVRVFLHKETEIYYKKF